MLTIGGVRVDPPLVLAPMEGVTDVSFRQLVRKVGGAGLVYTEFVPARGLSQNLKAARELVSFDEDERPIALQVYGRDPATLAEGARVAEALGADIVDLNMGCPSKKVCAHSGGSALLQDLGLATHIVRAMRAALQGPFTVKMRSGWDPSHRNALDVARMCEAEGVDAVTVHWRTRADGYAGTRDVSTIAAIKAALRIPVIANGDVVDAESGARMLADTGADGLMVGRGAIRNPWVFHELGHALYGRKEVVPDKAERARVLFAYFDDIRTRFGSDRAALGRWKKIAKYFTEGLDDGSLRTAFLRAETVEEARSVAERFFASA
ncbi:MAG: hypothetical protein RLZZ383_1887 [Pseudomonadota bacterium]|jgi:nifR3 family TIM-barrel protein